MQEHLNNISLPVHIETSWL